MDRNLLEEKVQSIVLTVLRIPATVGAGLRRENTHEWDSLKHVEIIFAVEDEFGVRFSEGELAMLDGVASIVAAVESKRAP